MTAFALFSSTNQSNRAENLEGESYTAVFGSVEVDFTRQPLAPGDHMVTTTALFGSVKLVFPADVELHLEVVPIFGSAELKDRRDRDVAVPLSGVRVIVRGAALFGSVEVIQRPLTSPPPVVQYQLTGDELFDPVTGKPIGRDTEGAEPRAYEGVTRKIGSDQ